MARLIITSEEELQHLHLLDRVKEIFPELKIEVMPDPSYFVTVRSTPRLLKPTVRKSMLCEVSTI
jgi:hypothetical protein